MIKIISTYAFLLAFNIIYGQADIKVNQMFLNLPLDRPRSEIQKAIKSDKRFKSTDKDTSDVINMFTYIGLSSDNGIVKSQPDSIEIELTWGSSASQTKRGKFKATGMTILKLRYFYSSRDSVDKEYETLLTILRPMYKNALFSRIDTVYSDSPIRAQSIWYDF